MGAPEIAGEAIKMLIPPKTNDLDAQQRWRWIVFAAIIMLFMAIGTHIALACGYVSVLFPGFASTADTKQIQKRVDVIASISLEREMRYKALELCTSKDPKFRQILGDDILKLQREYFDIEGRYFPIPNCDQL